jgi:hypothetical protein
MTSSLHFTLQETKKLVVRHLIEVQLKTKPIQNLYDLIFVSRLRMNDKTN